MANLIKKYYCTNFGNCKTANSKTLVEIADGEELICPECKKRMLVPAKTGPNKLVFIIIGVAILGCIIAAVILFSGKDEDAGGNNGDGGKITSVLEGLNLNKSSARFNVGDSDQLMVTPIPADAEVSYVWTSSDETIAIVNDGLVSFIGGGNVTITVSAEQNLKILASCSYIVNAVETPEDVNGADQVSDGIRANQVTNGEGSIDLGYAIYTGMIKNGKPHGNGTLEYKRSHKIISNKEYQASPGEKFIGTFREGKINMGTWYQKDGNTVVIKQ